MTTPVEVDLFGIPVVPDREISPVNNSRSLVVNRVPRAIAPAFAAPLTEAEAAALDAYWGEGASVFAQLTAEDRRRRRELVELAEQAQYRSTPLPRPLLPEPVVANLAAKTAGRFAEGAPLADQRFPRWMTRPVDSEGETGAGETSVNNCRRTIGVESRELASEHVSVLTGTELHQSYNSKDIRQLRGRVRQRTRGLFSRKSTQRKCGHTRFAPGVEVRGRDVIGGDGKRSQLAHVAGLTRCGSVWSCAMCAPIISHQRAGVVGAVAEAHRSTGGALYMGTFTVRHNVSMPLLALRRTVSKAFQKTLQGKGWTLLQRRMGFVGFIKAFECTCGANGWHPHLHVLFFLRRPLPAEVVAELETALFDRWCSALARVSELSGVIPSREHGVKFSESYQADYIQKLGLAAELTSGADKKARGENRTGFQVAVDLTEKGDAHDAHIFRRYARGMKGAKQLTWSRGKAGATDLRLIYAAAIRAMGAANEQPTLTGLESDAEILAAENLRGAVVASVPGRVWDAFRRVMHSAGFDPETILRTAAEREGPHGVEALIGLAYLLGKQMAATRPYLKKWLPWLAPPDQSTAALVYQLAVAAA